MDISDLPDGPTMRAAAKGVAEDFLDRTSAILESIVEDLPDPRSDLAMFNREMQARLIAYQTLMQQALGRPMDNFADTFDIPREVAEFVVRMDRMMTEFASLVVDVIDTAIKDTYNDAFPDGPRMQQAPPGLAGVLSQIIGSPGGGNLDDLLSKMNGEDASQADEGDIQNWLDSIPETDDPTSGD